MVKTTGKNVSKETLEELQTIAAETELDDRVFDDRMDSFEDDDREDDNWEEELEKQKATYLPPKLIESFAKKGLTLRWIRYLLQGKVDRLSLQKRIRQNYKYVRPEDIKAFAKEMSTDKVDFAGGDVILAGDLVLMSIPTKDVIKRRKLNEKLAAAKEKTSDEMIRREGFMFKRRTTTQNLYRGAKFGSDDIES